MGKYNVKNLRLNVADFQHPSDKAAIDAITAISAFEKVLEFVSKNSIEKSSRLINASSKMKITRNMSPLIFSMLDEAVEMFGCEKMPEVYIQRNYNFVINLDGIEYPYITFPNAWLETVSEDMLWSITAGEVAAIQAKHAEMEMVDTVLKFFKGVLPPGVEEALEFAMNNWFRCRIYTVDRAILVASGSFKLAAKHILYGDVPDSVLEEMELDKPGNPYYQQAVEFIKQRGVQGVVKTAMTAFTRSQWMASRYIELYNWYFGGEYHDLIERGVDL